MKKLFTLFTRNERGQGMLEYIIITSLVGIVCLVAVRVFGTTLRGKVNQMKTKINQEISI